MNRNNLEEEFLEKLTASQGIVHKVCGLYCDEEEERKDLFQEIVVNLWKSYPSFKGDSKFSTWMYRVSLNIAIQHLRTNKKKKEEVVLPSTFDQVENEPREQLPELELKKMHAAISKLSDVEKAIVMLYLEEKGNEEIAEIMGISENYARVKMTRIRTKLKELVEAE